MNIPLAISAQIVAYNVPGVTAHLKLSGKVLSEIYQGQVTNWNASQIASAQPGGHAAQPPDRDPAPRPTAAATPSCSPSSCPRPTPSGWGTKVGYNTTVNWPNAPGALGENGNSGHGDGMQGHARLCRLRRHQLPDPGACRPASVRLQLQNGKGQYELPTAATIEAEASYFTSKTPANGTISMIYGPVNNGYPIVNYEYAIVNSHQSELQHGQGDPLGPRSGRSTRRTATARQYLTRCSSSPCRPRS